MSVLTFSGTDKFIVRVFKNHVANPSNSWVNSYEFAATDPGDESVILDLAEKIVNFEIAIHLAVVNFVRVTISTWEADSVPYDPDSFFSTTTTGTGTNPDSSAPLGLNNCLAVARVAPSGRFGHMFYRGVLTEDAVEAPAGRTVLSDKPAVQTVVDDAITSSLLSNFIGIGASGGMNMALISKDGSNVRIVRELLVQGVSALPEDHAWFNRTSP
jgi:hypothetical protein